MESEKENVPVQHIEEEEKTDLDRQLQDHVPPNTESDDRGEPTIEDEFEDTDF